MIPCPEDEYKRAEDADGLPHGDNVVNSDSWTNRPNPNPIVRPAAQQAMNKLFQLDNQFWAKQNTKLTSYDVCPKGISCRDHKSLSPGVFHNCPVEHNTLGGDYVCDPYSKLNLSIANPSSVRVRSSRPLTKKKPRPTCSHCSLVSFNHEEPAVIYENYVQQCTMTHLPPEGPQIDKPIEQTIGTLRSALKALDDQHVMSYDAVKNVLIPGAKLEPESIQRWLAELKELIDPANTPNPLECKTASKRGSKMSLNRTRPRVPRHIIKPSLTARKTKSAMLVSSVSRSHPAVKPESKAPRPILNANFSNIKSRYMNSTKPPIAAQPDQSSTNGEVRIEISTSRQNVPVRPSFAKTRKSASQTVQMLKPPKPLVNASGDSALRKNKTVVKNKAIVKKKVLKLKRSSNKFTTGTSKFAKVKRKIKPKPRATPAVWKNTPTSKSHIAKKKKKAPKKIAVKPVKVKSFGFEFHLPGPSLKKSKPKKNKKVLGDKKDVYRAYILEMLEKDTKKNENKSFSSKDTDKGVDEARAPQSVTAGRQENFKSRLAKNVTVLYKNSNVVDGVDGIASSLGLATVSPTPNLVSTKNSGSKGLPIENKQRTLANTENGKKDMPSWAKKNPLLLPAGVKLPENAPTPSNPAVL